MTSARAIALGVGTLAAALTVTAAVRMPRQQAPPPEITVYKGPT